MKFPRRDDGLDWGHDGECTGECCRMITINADPERIAIMAARWSEARKKGLARGPLADPEFVVANFVLVRYSKFHADTGNLVHGKPEAQYRCSQWDGSTKRCMSYEERPRLCRAYGMEKHQQCPRADCTLKPYAEWHAQHRWEDDGGPVAKECNA